MSYKKDINNIAKKIPAQVVNLSLKRKRSNPPTQAFSNFLTHNEQGDWAEKLILNTLSKEQIPYIPVMYGKSDKITAGDPGFKEFYEKYQDELDSIGKRPDVLLYTKDNYRKEWGRDISDLEGDDLNEIVPKASAGLEVRSSAYLVNKFIPKENRPSLSFTPKVEDLIVILKWVNTYNVPHFYVQVFFDSIYIISLKDILCLLRDAEVEIKGVKYKKIYGSIGGQLVFVIEKTPKNQFKETIHIFLGSGCKIGEQLERPKLVARTKKLSNGRLLHYVSFNGGKADIEEDILKGLLINK